MKVRHQYIPGFYPEGFSDPENPTNIWRYEKGISNIINISSQDAAVERIFLSFYKK